MKKFISMFTAMMFMAVMLMPFAACSDDDDPVNPEDKGNQGNTDDPDDPDEVTISIRTTVEGNTIIVTVTPGSMVEKYSFAIGSADDQTAFQNGTLEGIIKVEGNNPTTNYEFDELEYSTSYTVYAIAEDKDGNKSALQSRPVTTDQEPDPGYVNQSAVTLSHYASRYAWRIIVTPNEYTPKFWVYENTDLTVQDIQDIMAELEMDEVELMYWLYDQDLIEEYEDEEAVDIFTWNSAPLSDVDCIVLAMPFDEYGNPGEVVMDGKNTGSSDPTTGPFVLITPFGYGYDAQVGYYVRINFIKEQNTSSLKFRVYGSWVTEGNTTAAIRNDVITNGTALATNATYRITDWEAGDQGEAAAVGYNGSTAGELQIERFTIPEINRAEGAKVYARGTNATKKQKAHIKNATKVQLLEDAYVMKNMILK